MLVLKSVYRQVRVHLVDRDKTGFSAGNQLYQFRVVSFGLSNVSANFCRAIDRVGLESPHVKNVSNLLGSRYGDGRNIRRPLKKLKRCFSEIPESTRKAEPDKVFFISKRSAFPCPRHFGGWYQEKTEVITNWPRPKNKHVIRSFLGFCTYC